VQKDVESREHWQMASDERSVIKHITVIDPRTAAAYINRGAVRIAKGEANQAIDDFNQAIAISPGICWRTTTAGRRGSLWKTQSKRSPTTINALN